MTKPTRRARSRLKQQTSSRRSSRQSIQLWQPIRERLQFLPLLVLAGGFYAGLLWLINTFHPEEVRNFLLPNSFLPFHVLLFIANFFLLTFLTLSRRWGLLLTTVIAWLLFLKLQNFTLDIWAWGSAVLMGVTAYGLRVIWRKSTGYNA